MVEEEDSEEEELTEWELAMQTEATAQWDRVRNELTPSDFPMKLVFLDKSGSMGFNETTFELLNLALNNSLHPKVGSTLVFLLAGPGETQMMLRRPGDAPVEEFEVELGCCTWFNEPVLETLAMMAPGVEKNCCRQDRTRQ